MDAASRILTFGVVVEGFLPAISPPPRRKLLLSRDTEEVHHTPNTLCLALLPRVSAHCIASIDACKSPTKRTADADHWFNKSAELRANQEAEFSTSIASCQKESRKQFVLDKMTPSLF
jgi:hypothetical protein